MTNKDEKDWQAKKEQGWAWALALACTIPCLKDHDQ